MHFCFKTLPGFANAAIELILIIFFLLLYTAKSSSSDSEPEANFPKIIPFATVVITQPEAGRSVLWQLQVPAVSSRC